MKTCTYKYYLVIATCLLLVAACSKMDDFKKFENGKEVVYIGKADSIEVHSGKNRVELQMQLADPKVSKVVVYWNNMADSLEVPVVNNAGIDLMKIMISNLPAGSYNFVIYTYDTKGNKSVPVNISGRSYGDVYEKALLNRPVKTAYRWSNATPLFIIWEKLDTTAATNLQVGAKIMYQDNDGINHIDSVQFDLKKDTSMFILPANVSNSAVIKYTTMTKPDSLATDTFYAPQEQVVYSFVPMKVIVAKEDASGVINVSPTNSTINKDVLTFTKTVNISRLSLDKSIAYSADVQLSTTGIPGGTFAMDLNDVSMTNSNGVPTSVLNVSANQQTAKLNFTIPKSTLDANAGKKIAFTINCSNLTNTKFNLSGLVYSVAVVVDVDAFMVVKDVTATYFKNAGGSPSYFIRSDASPTSRWGIAQDWIASSNVLNVYSNTKGGIDNWPGYNCLNMVRWGTPQIYDGKLYQTFTLPQGKYEFQVNFETIGVHPEWNPINTLYLVVADGAGLPNTSGVATSIAYSSYSTPKVGFTLSQSKTVSIGFLAYLENDSQEFRVRQVKLLQYIGAFD